MTGGTTAGGELLVERRAAGKHTNTLLSPLACPPPPAGVVHTWKPDDAVTVAVCYEA